MSFTARRATDRLPVRFAAWLVFAASVAGCNGNQSADQALERQIKDNPQLKRDNIAKFAGKVTVDGQPPASDCKMFVILTNAQHLDENAHLRAPRHYAFCDSDGKFAFGTYDKADGVPVGKYVVTFAEFHIPAARGMRRMVGVSGAHYTEPDELKNLYNDPDKNQADEKFNLDLQAPGKADYEFDLAVGSKEPAATPGPNAVTSIIPPQ
jgi:hypothetical protein